MAINKVLLFSPKHLENSPRGVRLSSIRKFLVEDGVKTSVICYSDDELSFCEDTCFISKSRFVRFIEIDPTKITNRLFKFIFKVLRRVLQSISIPDYYIFDVFKFYKKLSSLTSTNNYSHIVFVSSPFLSLLMIVLYKYIISKNSKGYHAKIVLDIGDPYSFNSAYNDSELVSKLKRKFERFVINSCDGVIVTNCLTKNEYAKFFSIEDIEVIPQGANDYTVNKDYNSSRPNEVRGVNNSTFNFVYAGVFYKNIRDPKYLYEAISSFGESVLFNLYGSGFDIPIGMNNIIDNGRLSLAELGDRYCNSDVLVFVDNTSSFQSSGKIFELLCAKKPILFVYSCEKSISLKEIEGLDFVFTCKNNTECIKSKIEEIINSDLSTLTYNYDFDGCSWKGRASKYLSFIDSVGE